jgi:hypothetical protein
MAVNCGISGKWQAGATVSLSTMASAAATKLGATDHLLAATASGTLLPAPSELRTQSLSPKPWQAGNKAYCPHHPQANPTATHHSKHAAAAAAQARPSAVLALVGMLSAATIVLCSTR